MQESDRIGIVQEIAFLASVIRATVDLLSIRTLDFGIRKNGRDPGIRDLGFASLNPGQTIIVGRASWHHA